MIAMLVVIPTFVSAQETEPDSFRELESKYLFGFTFGSDIGPQGERELELTTKVDFQKRTGLYVALEQEAELEYNPSDKIQIEAGSQGVSHWVHAVEGVSNRHSTNFLGLSSTFRFLPVARGSLSPIGLQIAFEPEWSRINSGGKLVTIFEAETRIIADTELVPDRLLAAFNAIYDPETERQFGRPNWAGTSTLGLTMASTYRLTPKVAFGGELEYYRVYDGVRFNTLAGDALFVGPTLHIQISGELILSAAFSTQVAGHAVDNPKFLDLTNFPRNKAFLRLVVEF